MMTHIINIKNELDNILTLNTSNVISLSGYWGIGKSYFWNEYISNNELQNSSNYKNYSYVSLFGIDSLEQLKHTIFERTVPIDKAGEDVSFKMFLDNVKKSAPQELRRSWRKPSSFLSAIKDMPIAKYFVPVVYKGLYLAVRDTLICLDDLERKGKNLRIRDVLGLVSELKEKRNCLVVLIYNKDQLPDVKQYEKLRDKVIDFDYQFERTSDEVFEIGFPADCIFYEQYRQKVNILGIRNIRIIRKLAHFDEIIRDICNTYHKAIYEQAAMSLPLLLALHYVSDLKNIPPKSFLKKSTYNKFKDEKEKIENEKQWETLLDEYGWSDFDEMDKLLDDMITRGYPDRGRLMDIIKKRDEQFQRGIRENEIADLWKKTKNCLIEDEDALIDNMLSIYKKNMEVVVPPYINFFVILLRKLDKEEDADAIIDSYIDVRKDWLKGINITESFYSVDPIDPILLFEAKFYFRVY